VVADVAVDEAIGCVDDDDDDVTELRLGMRRAKQEIILARSSMSLS
jgi:hypothetical protein